MKGRNLSLMTSSAKYQSKISDSSYSQSIVKVQGEEGGRNQGSKSPPI